MAATVSYLSTILATRKYPDGSQPTLLDIEAVVLGYYHISLHDLLKQRERTAMSEPRAVACWLATTMTMLPTYLIGQHFRRSSPTVFRLTRAIDQRADQDRELFIRLYELVRLVHEEASAAVPIHARLEVNAAEISQGSKQWDDGIDKDYSSNQDPNQEVNKAHEWLGNPVGHDGLEAGPDEVDEARDEKNDDKLDNEIDHDTVLLSGGCVEPQQD